MKKDFFDECFDKRIDPKEFKATFCDRCRNSLCERSKFGNFSWADRMLNQMDELFAQVERANPFDDKYKDIIAAKFQEILPEARAIEISMNNWEVPQIPILDGVEEIVQGAAKNSFQESLEKMVPSRKQMPPLEEEVSLEKEDPPKEISPKETPLVNPTLETQKPLAAQKPQYGNTVVPIGGVFLEGYSPSLPKKVSQESWEVPKEKIIPVGGTVTIQKKSS